MRKIKIPEPGQLYKIIEPTSFVYFETKLAKFLYKGHVILVSCVQANRKVVGYDTLVWTYILPDGRKGYHHMSCQDDFWEQFIEV